jgi:hypothetical protein
MSYISTEMRCWIAALCAEMDRVDQVSIANPQVMERASVICAEAGIAIARADCSEDDPRDRVVEAARKVIRPDGNSKVSVQRLLVAVAILDGRQRCLACEGEGGRLHPLGWDTCRTCDGCGTLETA